MFQEGRPFPHLTVRLATTVVALDAGRVVAQGPATAVVGDPTVLPAGPREAGAPLLARVARHHDDGLTELDAGGQALFLPRLPQASGTEVRVCIAAHDVILSQGLPEGLSALNILPGTVSDLRRGDGQGVIVALDTRAGRLLARITRRSVETLGLAPGSPVHAVVKTVSVAPEDIGQGGRDG